MMGRISTFPPELDLRVSRELRDEDEVEYEEGMSVADSVSAARCRDTVVESMCECSVVAVCDDTRCYIVSRTQYEDLHSVLHGSRSQCVLGDVAVYTHNTIRLMRRSKIHTKCAEPHVAPPVQLCCERAMSHCCRMYIGKNSLEIEQRLRSCTVVFCSIYRKTSPCAESAHLHACG